MAVGLFDRLKSRLGLSPEADEEYYEEDAFDEGDDSDDDPEGSSRRHLYRSPYGEETGHVRRIDRGPDLDRARDAGLRAVPSVEPSPAVTARPAAAPAQMNMYVCEPKSYSEAQVIGDRFKAGTPVIMNLTHTESAAAKRLFDFACGLTYGRDGTLQKIAERVFMLTPANVSVSAEDRRRLKDTGLFTFEG